MKIVVVSGGFDPIHSGHIAYFLNAKDYGDKLIVALNSDQWLINKKGKFFMNFEERKTIIENFSVVDRVIDFEDDSYGSAANALEKTKKLFPNDEIIFANGGDRNSGNIYETKVSNIEFIYGVGGDDKKNSSSWILKDWTYKKTNRVWGTFFNLFSEDDVKVKELIVLPGQGMSFQRHNKRSEIWLVSKGKCQVNFSKDDPNNRQTLTLEKFDKYQANLGEWHQITNPFKEACHIIEVQYGEEVSEDDIERIDYYKPE